MNASFEGKAVIVTAAGSGIGRAAALRFAEAGASVMAVDIDAETAARTAEEITAAGHTARDFEADVSSPERVAAMVEATVAAFGRLDCAFNNAGEVHPPKPMGELSDAELDAALSVNVKGTWHCMKEEVRQMRKQGGGGAIVNTSSGVGLRPRPGFSAYGASKAGVVYLTEVTALEYAADGIRVNSLCPGPTASPGFGSFADDPAAFAEQIRQEVPLRRLGEPVEMAAAVLWLCSEEASFVTGTVLRVDGGAGV